MRRSSFKKVTISGPFSIETNVRIVFGTNLHSKKNLKAYKKYKIKLREWTGLLLPEVK